MIPALQSDRLASEIERRLTERAGAVTAAAERDAHAILAEAHAAARRRMHEAIQELRREAARRLASAKVRFESERRAFGQREAAQAVRDTFPMLEGMMDARWRDTDDRRLWTELVARQCALRLRPGAWVVEHPPGWSEAEQRAFAAATGTANGTSISFKQDQDMKSGLRIAADQAVLDATPQGLLSDDRTVAAMILDEIGRHD